MHIPHLISDSWQAHGPYVYAGTTSGFSCISIVQAVVGNPMNAWMSAMLSILSTYLGWRLTERTRRQRLADDLVSRQLEQRKEDERRKRDEDRDQVMRDLIAQVKELKYLQIRETEPTPAKSAHL